MKHAFRYGCAIINLKQIKKYHLIKITLSKLIMATQINLSFLIETTKGNKDMISEIVSEVIKHIEEFSSSLPALKGKRDFTNIALESHKFKSSIQIIGAPTAYITIQNLENAAKNKDEIEVSSLSETVLQLIAVCHLELLAYMNLY